MTSVSNETSIGLFDLTGRVAPVTGAGKDLGRKAAIILAQAGADLALINRTRVDLEYLGKLVAAAGRKLITIWPIFPRALREKIGGGAHEVAGSTSRSTTLLTLCSTSA